MMGLNPGSTDCAETGPSKRLGQEKLGGDGATGLFNLFTGRGTDFRALDGELAGEVAGAQDFDDVGLAADETNFAEGGFVDDSAILESLIKLTHIHDFNEVLEGCVVEALLGQTTVHRHLSTFKARADAAACAGHLSLVTFAGGFAVA